MASSDVYGTAVATSTGRSTTHPGRSGRPGRPDRWWRQELLRVFVVPL